MRRIVLSSHAREGTMRRIELSSHAGRVTPVRVNVSNAAPVGRREGGGIPVHSLPSTLVAILYGHIYTPVCLPGWTSAS